MSALFTGRYRLPPELFLMDLPVISSDIQAESHQLADTSTPHFAELLQALLNGYDWRHARQAEEAQSSLRSFLDTGEHACARQLADELATFWEQCLAPHWSEIRDHAEADITHRAGITVRHGLGAAISSLHPAVAYDEHTIRLDGDVDDETDQVGGVTLIPSWFAHRWYLGPDPHCPHGRYLIYPTARSGIPRRPAAEGTAEVLGEVLGHTRLMLLASLCHPRTTTRLAARHHLSPSTVSYHLTRLYRAGLLAPTRAGASVRYRRTAEAGGLLQHTREGHQHGCRAGRGRPPLLGAAPLRLPLREGGHRARLPSGGARRRHHPGAAPGARRGRGGVAAAGTNGRAEADGRARHPPARDTADSASTAPSASPARATSGSRRP
ncbi:helix-turn-helix domain-containing protein [Streptomyces sp. A1499]|uniref:ArsR/SmtB family transcription factor n=1 Tax=Streptomyces sp. A1499 TaxID=2563104 RepID=UPI00144AF29A|nr:helix-turn-helix domain-containing protein [Streptomyces sp. A1499]